MENTPTGLTSAIILKSALRNLTSAIALSAILLAFCSTGAAQQPKKIYRVGFITSAASLDASPSHEAFRHDLRELGYIEGQNLVIEWRFTKGKLDPLPGFAADLVRLKSDVIVVTSTQATLAAKKATQTIPIVFATADDPVGSGLVASLAQPGGNATGVTDLARELAGKRLELLKDTLPKISLVAVLLWNPAGPGHAAERKEIESAARAMGIQLQPVEVRGPEDLETGFTATIRAGVNALMALTDTRFAANRARIVKLSAENRLPVMYQDRQFVEAGGLMSYGTNRGEWRRRTASYVDRILQGAKPADLPVEQPTKFEFVVNLKTAKQIGLIIPPNVLARADKVIR